VTDGHGRRELAVVIGDAAPADLEELVALARRFNQADGHEHDESRVRSALACLLDDDRWGVVLLIRQGATAVGYAVLTLGYSIESGGVDALLDEIYLDVRGQGLGSELLEQVMDRARQRGASRLLLETEAANTRVRALYRRHGFDQDDSIWMSRSLEPGPQPPAEPLG
jgi:GNAT superfamily N-acetyltransferase